MKKRALITLDEKTHKDFKKYCEERGMKVSSKIELMMRRLLKNGKS